jgi:hypothetical protein
MTSRLPDTVDALLDRAADPVEFERWRDQARRAQWCRHPVRLVGSTVTESAVTGEIVSRFSSGHEPDGVVLKGCGQRRATACPSCAERYRADAWQLIAAGMRGGKGIPDTVNRHPSVFATFTAPGFGPVHRVRDAATCHSRSGTCAHGRPLSCHRAHSPDEEVLGEPLCVDCYDYRHAVIWNALAGELWRRTLVAMQRHLATAAGSSTRAGADMLKVAYAKVVEYQRRGCVHLHVVIRLDGPRGAASQPPEQLGLDALAHSIRLGASHAAVSYPAALGDVARWGEQLDIRAISTDDGVRAGAVAGYIAKYATKSTDAFGRLDRRLKAEDLEFLALPAHLDLLVRTAWALADEPGCQSLRLRHWAHTLGYRGHWLTKSRGWSTTFAALRQARSDWTEDRKGNRTPVEDDLVVVKRWAYAGRGWSSEADAWLAGSLGEAEAERRKTARPAAREQARLEEELR